jgi:hypothetical protein
MGVDRGYHTPGVSVQQREYLLSWIQQGGGRETEILKLCGTDGGRGYRHAMGDKQSATSWGNHDRFSFSDPQFHRYSKGSISSSSDSASSSKVFTPRSPILKFQWCKLGSVPVYLSSTLSACRLLSPVTDAA